MQVKNTILLIATLMSTYLSGHAQMMDNQVFSNRIKSVRLFPTTNEIALPIITLFGSDRLLFSFDDLSEDSKTYYYTVIQCDFKWEPTQQNNFEYIDGFTQPTINNYQFSANTRTLYTHYRMEFPNEDMTIRQSGNYILVVYEDSPDEPLITRRFMVAESRVGIEAQIVIPRTSGEINRFHEVLFNVTHTGFQINNGLQEVRASILQNQRWDNAVIGLAPRMTRPNLLNYDHNGAVVFEAGREFRRFDIRSLRFNGEGVRSIQGNDVYLLFDQVRNNQRYFIETDINGQFFIDVQEFRNRNTESDYARVHFNLSMPFPLSNGKIYVGGMFNEYKADDASEMVWNPELRLYESSALLKQGFYNYMYYFMPNRSTVKDLSLTEGNHFDAENQYDILIYFRPFGERYDRLVGYRSINSMAGGQR
jgi:hypothetical protein